jgi:hypothetical protein
VSEHDDDGFSPPERRALDLWRAPEPPDDFAARVLTRLEAERSAPRALRQVAVAALAVVLVGGFFAARLLSGASSTFGEVHRAPGDGGSSGEVSPLADGVRS